MIPGDLSRLHSSACPHLPTFQGLVTVDSMARFRTNRGPDFYRAALTYAQSLWVSGKPGQAILQLNKAWSADLAGNEDVLAEWPPPYKALVWILRQDAAGSFLGNPVRHFQHLASRMSGPRTEVRSWRAWVCFHLSESCLENDSFPRDQRQIEREELAIPSIEDAVEALAAVGWLGESELAAALYDSLRNS